MFLASDDGSFSTVRSSSSTVARSPGRFLPRRRPDRKARCRLFPDRGARITPSPPGGPTTWTIGPSANRWPVSLPGSGGSWPFYFLFLGLSFKAGPYGALGVVAMRDRAPNGLAWPWVLHFTIDSVIFAVIRSRHQAAWPGT